MADSYIRKFSPNVKHIIAFVLLLISAVMLVSGLHRAFRVMGRLDSSAFVFDGKIDELKENDSILLHEKTVRARLKEAVHDTELSCGQNQKHEIFVINFYGYRFAAVETGSDEYDKLLGGEGVTGYFSYKYSQIFRDRIAEMGQYFEPDTVIPESECSDLGIIIVDRERELRSWMWCLPFLIVGLLLLKIGGSPFFYFPEDKIENVL